MNRRRKILVVTCVGAVMMIWLLFLGSGEERGVPVHAGDDVMEGEDIEPFDL